MHKPTRRLALLLLLGTGGSAWAQVSGSSTVAIPAPPPPSSAAELLPSAPLDVVLEGKDRTGSPPKPPAVEVSVQTATVGERAVPDYDNLAAAPVSAGEVLIWVPRVIFFPVHLVFEYLLRWPIVSALTWAEEVYLFKRITNFFTWRDGKSGIYPTFLADFGLKPAVGLTTFHDDFPFDGNNFSASIGWWYPNWWNVRARNRTTVLSDDSGKIDVIGAYVERPDYPFYGVGARTRGEVNPPFRYDRHHGEAGLAFLASLGELSRFRVSSTYRFMKFGADPEVSGDTVALPETAACANGDRDPEFGSLPFGCAPGFNYGDVRGQYHLIDSRIEIKVDTRDPDIEYRGGTGILLELFGGFSISPNDTSLNFIRYGGELAGFYDFTDLGHVLAIRLRTELLWRTGASVVPFTELPSLGGLDTMHGYLAGRFLGDSTIEAQLSYRYPVWSILHAIVFAGVGNSFSGHYGVGDPGENFSFERLFFDAGIGLRTSIERDTGLQILVAFGTNRFDGGDGKGPNTIEVDSVRFVFGVAEGF